MVMRFEYLFFLMFLAAAAIGYGLTPYVSSNQEQQKRYLEAKFSDFTLYQRDSKGFKSKITGTKGLKYSTHLQVQNFHAIDREDNTARAKDAKMVDDQIFLNKDVIITTPDNALFLTQSALYDSKNAFFRSVVPFEAYWGEHEFYGDQFFYQDGVIRAQEVRTIIKQG